MEYGNFTDHVLVTKIKEFLQWVDTIETSVGEVCGDHVYTGVDLTHYGTGKTLRVAEQCKDYAPQLFSDRAVEAMRSCEDKDLQERFERVNTLKELLSPVTLEGKIKLRSSSEGSAIGRIRAECRPGCKVAPMIIYHSTGQVHVARPLTDYMKEWGLAGVGSILQFCPELEFSEGNYIKTLVFHAGGDLLVIDGMTAYTGREEDPTKLVRLGMSEKLDRMVANNHIPESMTKYFSEANTENIVKHLRWIMPLGCGEHNDIYLDKKGKVQKKQEGTDE